ncbi:hypothetical protein DPMN_084935 [Dreissena polymorpha]|uniref:Uncharacterized protein n=1 Tax=Dreissena polymorpha TaxID=45954 RepID=A0A9D4BJV0_DREPO|nr:hypothetical protein DPMN_084935 [Dreissena polymorpha]
MCSSYMGLVHSSSKGVSGRDVSSSCAGIGDSVAKTGSLIGVAVYKWLGSFLGNGQGSSSCGEHGRLRRGIYASTLEVGPAGRDMVSGAFVSTVTTVSASFHPASQSFVLLSFGACEVALHT